MLCEETCDDDRERLTFAYFFVSNDQTLDEDGPVVWDPATAITEGKIFLDPDDTDDIIIHRGVYLATFSVTAIPSIISLGEIAIRFELRLNGTQIIGSSYAVSGENTDPALQDTGQVIFFVNEDFSVLELVNDSEVTVNLVSDVVDAITPNVSASLAITKLADLEIRSPCDK